MKYQLVLQFPENSMNYEAIDKLESSIMSLQNKVDVDGHDIGGDEINFFILTDDPDGTFKQINILLNNSYRRNVKAAYREIAGEDYIILWPKNLREFRIK